MGTQKWRLCKQTQLVAKRQSSKSLADDWRHKPRSRIQLSLRCELKCCSNRFHGCFCGSQASRRLTVAATASQTDSKGFYTKQWPSGGLLVHWWSSAMWPAKRQVKLSKLSRKGFGASNKSSRHADFHACWLWKLNNPAMSWNVPPKSNEKSRILMIFHDAATIDKMLLKILLIFVVIRIFCSVLHRGSHIFINLYT